MSKTSVIAIVEKARYIGTVLYQAARHHPHRWLMQLLVAKHDASSTTLL